ncbi:7TMR-DISM family protein [Tenacibaculum ovolyticum]|uniref:7TMR-DISM family protein n=1 Tax=Tenacibaculum ovolyticum TaxID=104270 RepID=UPI0009D6ECED|nr:7TM diverse intracellular signaling domain-containing protein [Tenacibaculum ovolyticum]
MTNTNTAYIVCLQYKIFICLFFFNLLLYGQTTTINADSLDNTIYAGKNISYFLEDGRSLTIDSISSKSFKKSENDILSFGYSTKAVWLKLRIQNATDTPINKVLSIQKALQDSIQFFYKEKGSWKMSQSGQMINEANKALPGFSISFPVTLKKESTHTFYIRTVSKYGKVFALKLLDNAAYAKNEQRELIIGWLLIGILITIIIYNFSLARSLKDHIYDFYCLSVIGALLLQLVFRGFFKHFVLDNSPFLQEWSPIFAFSMATVFSSYFCIRFLNTKKYSKQAHWALIGIIVLIIIAFLYPFICYEVFGIYTDSRLLGYFGILFSFIAIYAGIKVYLKGNKSARFLIYAWAVFCVTILLYSLASLNIVPPNIVTMNSYLVGSVLEVFLLSLALGDRYVHIRKQKNILRKNAALQEQIIADRNAEISSLNLETLQYIKSKQHLTEELKRIDKQQDGITIKEVLNRLQVDKIKDTRLEILKRDIDALTIAQTNKLKLKFPKLTKGDMELVSFILLGLKRKEIAIIRNISFEAVKKNIYRLRKKLALKPNESLEEFITSL